jgi:hypothetical protein
MERQVENYIHNLSDVDLLGYTRNFDHLPEAREFARIELTDRHFSPDHLAELEKELQHRQQERREQERLIAAEPLNLEWRIVVFLCGLYFGIPLLLFIPAWLRFREEGAYRRNKDMCIFAVAGFAMIPILTLLRIPPWSWLIKLF